MIAQFHWHEADYVSAQKVWLRHHPWIQMRGYWFPVAIAALSIAIVVFKPDVGLKGMLGIIMALLLFGFSALRTRWRWHQHFRQTPLWRDEVTAKVDQQGVSLRSQSYDVRHSWGECSDIYEAAGVIVIEAANESFFFLPKRDMSRAQLLDLRNTIVTYARVEAHLAAQTA